VGGDRGKLLGRLWESNAPLKVIVFSLQMFHHRLPTRVKLLTRGVVVKGTVQ